MPELQLLRLGHAEALLAFELTNRPYFAASVSDRGDEYFHEFTERLAGLLAEQASGNGSAYYVLAADDASIIGRVNLKLTEDGTAELGYRVAEAATGREVATTAVAGDLPGGASAAWCAYRQGGDVSSERCISKGPVEGRLLRDGAGRSSARRRQSGHVVLASPRSS